MSVIDEMSPQTGNVLDSESTVHNDVENFTGAKRVMDNDHAYIHQGKAYRAFFKYSCY